MEIDLTPSQSTVFLDETSKAVAFVTGFGGGKTFLLCLKMITYKLKYPKNDLLYLFPTFSMFRDILFPTLHEILEDSGIEYRINKSTGEIFFAAGGRVILKSCDNPETIVGFNVLCVFFDELDTLATEKAQQVWIKAIARARSKAVWVNDAGEHEIDEKTGKPRLMVNQLIVGTTPEGYRFVYQMFGDEEKRPANYRLVQASGRENIHLPANYYDDLRVIYADELIDAYIEGKFVNLTAGGVYTQYDRELCDTDAIYRDGEILHISMDFNVRNMNAVVYVERGVLNNSASLYNGQPVLHAIHHLTEIVDTPEMIQVIINKFPRSPIFVYPDASGRNVSSKGITTSDISLLTDAGFHVRAPNKNPRVLDRVQSANSAFKTGLVKISVSNCNEVVESLEQQVYNQKTELPDKKASVKIDDINDAVTYIIHYRYPLVRNSMMSIGHSQR